MYGASATHRKEGVTSAIDFTQSLAQEPSTGCFYIQEHVQQSVPKLMKSATLLQGLAAESKDEIMLLVGRQSAAEALRGFRGAASGLERMSRVLSRTMGTLERLVDEERQRRRRGL